MTCPDTRPTPVDIQLLLLFSFDSGDVGPVISVVMQAACPEEWPAFPGAAY
jgi:hypothetical protein